MSDILDSFSNIFKAQQKLILILEKARKVGVQVDELKSVKKILNKPKNNKTRSRKLLTSFVLLFSVIIYYSNIWTHEGFATAYMKWKYGTIHKDTCAIPMPDELFKVFRPPVRCGMCENVKEVDRVAGISPDEFENRYAYSGRPVVVTDGMMNWTAQNIFTFEFFKKTYQERMEEWSSYNCQFFPYKTEFQHLKEVFNMSDDRAYMAVGTKPWYIGWSNCDHEVSNILRKHYQKPYFLPTTAESKKLDWIFMGSTGYGAPMHVDNVEHPSWQAQLQGSKKWILQPPPECFYTCQNLEVHVQQGEIIVLDTNQWYHSTVITSENISITLGAEFD